MKGREGIALHRSRRIHLDDRDEIDGIPVTSLSRTLIDLAEISTIAVLRRDIEVAERSGDLNRGLLQEVCRRTVGRKGPRLVLAALGGPEPPDVRFELERRFAKACRDVGLPMPLFNTLVEDYEVDVHWPGTNLIVELDSWGFHGTRDAFERDRVRDADLAIAGYRVLRITWRRLHGDPHEAAAHIRALLARGERDRRRL